MRSFSSKIITFLTALLLFCSCKKEKTNRPIEISEIHGINLKFLDTTVSPKEDFFRFVNGAWLDSTAIPEDRTTWGSFNELRKKTDEDMLAIIKEASKDTQITKTNNQYKAVALYNTIMDTISRNQQGLTPIKSHLSKIATISDIRTLQSYLEALQQHGRSSFFNISVFSDAKDSNSNNLYISPSRLGLPDRDYYIKDDPDSIEKRKKYVAHIAKMLRYLGDTPEEATLAATQILTFEITLAAPRLDKVERRDTRNTYNPRAVTALHTETPQIEWNSYLTNVGVPKLDTLIVSQPKYMKALSKILTKEHLPVIKLYLRWQLLNEAAGFLSTTIEKDNWEFYGAILQGAKKQLPLNERALATVNTSIGESLGQLYVSKKFPPEAKAKAEEMIANIIKAYENRIKALAWMSDSTKEKALKKLGTIQIKIGYPNKWKDYSALEISGPESKGTYAQNMMNIAHWRYQKGLKKLNKTVDKTEWFMSPQTVNAYYNPSYNEIVFPAAILQPPFYDYKADAAVNYGGIGAVIGHEISHGFDDSGARFDADGNLNDWWTKTDLEKFENLGKNLADQYSSIEVLPGTHINGAFTLGENIGDLGGVTAAYDGLQLHFEKEGKPEAIDGYTAAQRFFMSWATIWRTKMRDEALKNRIKTDPHSPGMYRAYVPLTNIDAFYKAFGIKKTDKMYLKKEERVQIW